MRTAFLLLTMRRSSPTTPRSGNTPPPIVKRRGYARAQRDGRRRRARRCKASAIRSSAIQATAIILFMPIAIFDPSTIPRDRRTELEAAVVAAAAKSQVRVTVSSMEQLRGLLSSQGP